MANSTTLGRWLPPRVAQPVTISWLLLFGVAAFGILALVLVETEPERSLFYYSIASGAVIAAVVGACRGNDTERRPWLLLAAGLALLVVADVVRDHVAATGADMAVSIADPMCLAGHALLGWALVNLLHIRYAERADVLDALIVVVAAGSVLWILVADGLGGLDPVALLISLMYPVLDLVLLGVVMAALFAVGRPDWVTGALIGASLALLASDQLYGFVETQGLLVAQLTESGWLTAYLLLATATILPRRKDRRRARHDPNAHLGWSSLRFLLLLVAATVPLLSMLVESQWRGSIDALRVAGATALMFALLVFRMELVIRRQRTLLRERLVLESSLQRQAIEDPLTGLANRRGLFDHLAAATAGGSAGLTLMVLDLDDFKFVNDRFGHPAGDALLRVIAHRLRSVIRAEDLVARLGGDEFAIVAHGFSTETQVAALARRVLSSLDEPVALEHRRLAVSTSIGIATTAEGNESVEELLRDADNALYEAKDRGRHRWVIFDPQMRVRALRRLSIDGELARAVAEHEFELSYQPMVTVATGRIEWVEALLRWHHPSLGVLGPSEFLPAAERSSHMAAIARWVLEEATTAAAGWHAGGHEDVGVSINLSTGQLLDPGIVESVRSILAGTELPARYVMLELLESSFETTTDLLGRLEGLRALGVSLALDDFGSGFSSLARLGDVPVSVLKFDRSLVAGRPDPKLVGAVVRLGRTLGLYLVAEGVETKRELERMRRLGCDAIQGYIVTRPLPASRIQPFLRSWKPQAWLLAGSATSTREAPVARATAEAAAGPAIA